MFSDNLLSHVSFSMSTSCWETSKTLPRQQRKNNWLLPTISSSKAKWVMRLESALYWHYFWHFSTNKPNDSIVKSLICSSFSPLQRFKGTEPVEEVTEQVKAVKIEEKPKEVKAEVVEEVLLQHVDLFWFVFLRTVTKCTCIAFLRVLPSTPSRCWKRATRQTFRRKARQWAAGTRVPWRMALYLTQMFPQVWLNVAH